MEIIKVNFDNIMVLVQFYVRPFIDDTELVMPMAALKNILGHDNCGDRPTKVLLMAAGVNKAYWTARAWAY